MKMNEFSQLIDQGMSKEEIQRKYGLSNRVYNTFVTKLKTRQNHNNGAPPAELHYIAPVEHDAEGAYWAGVFDALGQLDVRVKDAIVITARFATRQRSICDAFSARYGGTLREGEGMYAMILEHADPGLHRLITDLSYSKLYADKAGKLAQWLEYRFYLAEQERLLIASFTDK